MIRTIEIQNIKGIQHNRFDLDILPNKPSILVAPNGFGKTSLATAFNSLKNNRINLTKEDCYSKDENNSPQLHLEYQKENGTNLSLEATYNTNTISDEIDYFVINNLTKPKGDASTFQGFGNRKATLVIEDVVLVNRVPKKVTFGYSYTAYKKYFGANGKILPNIDCLFNNLLLIEKISQHYKDLERANGKRIQRSINYFIAESNRKRGTSQEIIEWINQQKLSELQNIDYLSTISDIINEFDIGLDSGAKIYLAAIQLIWKYNEGKNRFKEACSFSNFNLFRQRFNETISKFNRGSWRNISLTQTGNQLVIKFPKAYDISNGERDILIFISKLFEAKRNLNKRSNVLIIDEIFDYLDDANLTAAQYYISTFIKEFKAIGHRIYPLILTHLNPNYFKNFAFSNQKVYFLDRTNAQVKEHLKKLLRNRKDPRIKQEVDKHLLHYHPENINLRNTFRQLNLPELWGVDNNFRNYLQKEMENYLNNQNYDPIAVCGELRIKIEEIAYSQLNSNEAKNAFIYEKGTRKKLEKAEEMGAFLPETYYLLGIIYNEGLHWKDNQDVISPIVSKLENLTIKNLICDVYE